MIIEINNGVQIQENTQIAIAAESEANLKGTTLDL